MKFIHVLVFFITLIACEKKQQVEDHSQHTTDNNAAVPTDTIIKSIPKELHGFVSKTHVTMKYHAPNVRGRVIWGGLVPYDQVWVSGAHMATSVEFSTPVLFANQKLEAGKYAFFTIPSESTWTIIINKNWNQHLTDAYQEEEDVLRVMIEPMRVENLQERLHYSLHEETSAHAYLQFSWEYLQLKIPIISQ